MSELASHRYYLGLFVTEGQKIDVEIEIEPTKLWEYMKDAYTHRDRHGQGSIEICKGIYLMVKD